MPKVKYQRMANARVTTNCECGSPFTHATKFGAFCSNPNCKKEVEIVKILTI